MSKTVPVRLKDGSVIQVRVSLMRRIARGAQTVQTKPRQRTYTEHDNKSLQELFDFN